MSNVNEKLEELYKKAVESNDIRAALDVVCLMREKDDKILKEKKNGKKRKM